MKLMRIGETGNEKPCVVDEQSVARDVSSLVADFSPETLGNDLLNRLAATDLSQLPAVSTDNVRIASPMSRPRTIFCIGLNYSDHAAESGMAIPEEPILFSKASAAFSGPNDAILHSTNVLKLDWEVELGIVIGKEALNINEADVDDYIFGYTLVNDISERSWQAERSGQWIKGKSYPSFCPTGPVLVTKDDIADPQNLDMWLDVNGERQQTGSTSKMIFSARHIVAYLSQFAQLEPGDLICTGTPPGVGMGQKPPRFLKPGDVVTLGIDGLGDQQQSVVEHK